MKIKIQRDIKDCGVTCVAYLIEYYKGYVPIERLRDDTNTNRNGTTAYDLVETLKKYHFDSYGKKVSYEELNTIFLPAILHVTLENGMKHFVILYKNSKSGVVLMDPMMGKRKMSKEEFLKIWENVVIIAVPYDEVPSLPKEPSTLKMLYDICKLEYSSILKIVILNFLLAILIIITSLYLKIGFDEIITSNFNKAFTIIVASFSMLYLIKFILDYGKEKIKLYLSKNIEISYVSNFIYHILKIPLQKFNTYQEGEIITRVEEVEEIKTLFCDICITFFLEFILSFITLIVLYFLNSSLCFILIVGMILYFGLGILTAHYFYHIVIENMNIEANWKDSLIESIRLMSTMKHLNAYSYQKEKLEENFCYRIDKKLGFQQKILRLQSLKESFLEILFFILMTYGLYQSYKGTMNIVDFITFQSLYVYFTNPLKELIEVIPKFYYMKGIVEKISEYTNLQEEKIENITTLWKNVSISFQNVSFSYQTYQKNICDVSFEIKDHSKVFLKGSSGCGKSTICKLLIQELTNYEGDILINQQNIKDYSLGSIRHNIIYLSQNENIFEGTLKENILYGSKMNDDVFAKISMICELESIVKNKPLRYETTVNEYSLSGGEKQRIILARALMKEAKIYIFDECLSEVEESLERKIIRKLQNYLKEKTIIYISHRNQEKLFSQVICIGN